MAVGVTQPGGAGTTIFIEDDASSASGLGYTYAEIAAAFPVDFISNTTNKPSYKASVSLQVHDTTTSTATTTLTDTAESTVIFNNTRTLIYRATQTTSEFTVHGTKVGTGNAASGRSGSKLVLGAATTFRGDFKYYGTTIQIATGTLTITSQASPSASEMVNCLVQSEATTGNAFSILATIANLYNVDFSARTNGTIFVSWNVANAERITIADTAPTTYLQFPAGTANTIKDIVLFGTPSRSDFSWSAATVVQHKLVRPVWSGNGAKFGFSGGAATPVLASATLEYWGYDMKVVDGTGAAIAGIPVRLTDTFGNVHVDTTTTSDGRLSYGSGLTANAVAVMDHYSDGVSAYVQRHRSPFLAEINTAAQAGYNSNYASRRFFFSWPGSEGVTTSSGTFEDVGDLINLSEPSGGQTSWTECSLP